MRLVLFLSRKESGREIPFGTTWIFADMAGSTARTFVTFAGRATLPTNAWYDLEINIF